MCHLEPKQFVGSMCFTRFIQSSHTQSKAPARRVTPTTLDSSVPAGRAGAGGSTELADSAPAAVEAVASAPAGDYNGDELEYIDDSYVPGGAGVFEDAKGAAMDLLRKESFVGEVALALVTDTQRRRQEAAGLEHSLTTVTTTSDVSGRWPPRLRA